MEPILLTLLRTAADNSRIQDRPPLDLAEVDWALQTGGGPILHEMSLHTADLVPKARKETLLLSELAAKAASKRLQTAMTGIIDACEGSLGRLTLLKGISVRDQYYPKPHWRPMGDIDFLVPKEDLPAAESALKELGYQQVPANPMEFYQQHHHGMPLQHPTTGIVVEIHTTLFPDWKAVAQSRVFQLPNIEAQLRPSAFHGKSVYRLSDELQLIYLSSHAAIEHRLFHSLIPFLDIIFLLQRTAEQINWDTVFGWLDNRAVAAHLLVMLAYLERHELIKLPRGVREGLLATKHRPSRLSLTVICRSIDRYTIRGQSMNGFLGPHNRDIIWGTLLQGKYPLSSLAFLRIPWNLAFPPTCLDRFQTKFQRQRLRSALSSIRKEPPSSWTA